ncbi:MAG TPA: tetratricopeptide repeat protein [Candidatus Omnitrophica bacterium]|nr:tetratricopeptide repeat protein [Candidatus Omnitrophota bacterium]
MIRKTSYIIIIPLLCIGCSTLIVKDSLDSFVKDYQSSRYQQAAVEFSYFIEENPHSQQLEKAYFYLGKCYFGMKNYYLAGMTFQKYLQRWPNGKWAEEAYEHLRLINSEFKTSYTKKDIEQEYQRLALAYREVLGEEIPKDRVYLKLGDIYWEEGKNEMARQAYNEAISLNPSLKRKKWLMERIEKLTSPEIEAKPSLRIINRYLRDLQEVVKGTITEDNTLQYTEKEVRLSLGESVVISGEVENSGSVSIPNLRIRIVCYDFYRRVLNSSFAYVGRIDPGETKPFSVTMKGLSKAQIDKVDYGFVY